jgi:hypothetical protein
MESNVQLHQHQPVFFFFFFFFFFFDVIFFFFFFEVGSKHRQLLPLRYGARTKGAEVANNAFVAPCATLVGSVEVWDEASVWCVPLVSIFTQYHQRSHFLISTKSQGMDVSSKATFD